MLFDESKLMTHFDQDKEMILELVEVLKETYPETSSKLKTAIESEDFSNIELHAHTVKGMLSNFFAEELRETAFKLEKMGREKSLDKPLELYASIDEKVPLLIRELRGFCG